MQRCRTVLLLVASLIVLASCSAPRRQALMEIFFDDPPRQSPDREVTTESAHRPATAKPPTAGPALSRHAPYISGDCNACHDLSASLSFPRTGGEQPQIRSSPADSLQQNTRLRFAAGSLCYKCHMQMTVDELLKKNTVIHGAVTQGFCGCCHDPHESRFPRLLVRGDPPSALCDFCHEPGLVAAIKGHADAAASDCLSCHKPHASRGRYLLREGGSS